VVVVDDDQRNLKLIAGLLTSEGYETVTATSGQQALELMEEVTVEAIVTDLMMPEMDGFELVRKLRSRDGHAHVPVIMMTAMRDRTSRIHGLESGADDFLTKPVDALELSVRMRNLVRLKHSRDALARQNEHLESLVAQRTVEIRLSEAFLRDTLDSLSARIAIVASDGRIVAVNRAWTEFGERAGLQWPAGGVGSRYSDAYQHLLRGGNKSIAAIDRGIARVGAGEQSEFVSEYQLEGPTGKADDYLMRVTRFRGAGDRPVVISHEDITEIRHAERALAESERQLRHAQRLESIGVLAGGVAHDFNNLLSVIFSYADTLREELGPAGAASDDVEQILQAANRASVLTRQLLAYSRKQVLKPRTTTLNKVVSNMENMLRRLVREDIEVSMSFDSSPTSVTIDVGQVEQVVMNLVVNARDAMPQGGTITVSTATELVGEEVAAASDVESGEYAALRITDTGSGIDEATQRRIFEPFFTTKKAGAGTGLGLSTVIGIVQQSSGFIEVRSTLGEGTTFVVFLPTVEKTESGEFQAQSARSQTASPSGQTVLVVEDDPLVRVALRRLLTKASYSVVTAADGNEGLHQAALHEGELDLVVSDVVMPGMDGVTFVRRLREQYPGLPALLMTGYTDDPAAYSDLEGDSVPVLEKPFSAHELLDAVASAQAKSQ
jgi:DNA-binding response OmpR family regulator/nitrogen-specific signal transduction histidine kinase